MSLSDLAAFGSFVSGLAVLVSLVFLYFQMRQVSAQIAQAEKNQMATIRQGRTNRIVDMAMGLTDPAAAAAVTKGNMGDLTITATEFAQFQNYAVAYINHAEDSFQQHQDGLLNDAAFEHFKGGLSFALATPGLRIQLQTFLRGREDPFALFIAEIISRVPIASSDTPLAQWTKAVEASRNASGQA